MLRDSEGPQLFRSQPEERALGLTCPLSPEEPRYSLVDNLRILVYLTCWAGVSRNLIRCVRDGGTRPNGLCALTKLAR